jgi:hypothetical protein
MNRFLLTIALLGLSSPSLAQQPALTFTKDIAPLLQRSCQTCHRAGAIAPMALVTYQDVRPWVRSIRQKVTSREMPPWYIDRNVGIHRFKEDPSLSDAEIATITAWIDAGAPQGNLRDLPPPRAFTDDDKWHIGKPDIVISLPKPYELRANGPDEFYDVDIDPGFTEDMYISAIETKPEAYSFKVIHHATANLIEDEEEDPVGLFLNEYALGKNGDIFPDNAGRLIKAGSKIHFNLHLHPSGERSLVNLQMGIRMYPKGQAPKYVAFTQHMGDNNDIDIRPGEITRTDGYFRLPKPAVVTAFQPHMHNRGKAMCMEVIYPDIRPDSARPGPARTETLSCVSNYQFGWHITYPYAEDSQPLLPEGTIIHITAWHDNTPANKYNPNPRNWVGYGQRTIDEMSFAWVSLFYIDQADYEQRVEARRKITHE